MATEDHNTTFEQMMDDITQNEDLSFEQKMKRIGHCFKKEMERISRDFQTRLHQDMEHELQYLRTQLKDIWKPHLTWKPQLQWKR